MSGVSFEEETATHSYGPSTSAKGIPKWLVTNGFAKTENGANKLLIALSIASIVIAMGLFLFMPKEKTKPGTAAQRALLEASTPKPPRIQQ
ncbi:MAG: hypothetical protein JWN90_490 [Parcubacteria group bacterium]|nr:hypothetical protein [Parcubacteria group bacterium]